MLCILAGTRDLGKHIAYEHIAYRPCAAGLASECIQDLAEHRICTVCRNEGRLL